MKAKANGDVGNFAIFRALIFDDTSVSSDVTDAFWFPDKSIKSDDLVVLYTKKGTEGQRVMPSGQTVHFYYWGKDDVLWSGSNHAPVLIYASDWKQFIPLIRSHTA